jgi:regulatory protein
VSHDSYLRTLQEALRLLRARDRTESEVRDRLLTKGFDEGDVGLVVKSLRDRRYLDDERVAMRAAELAGKGRPKGRRRLEAELLGRGAEESAIEKALGSLGDQLESALTALKLRPAKTPERDAAYLARLGFDEETVRAAIERVYGDLG